MNGEKSPNSISNLVKAYPGESSIQPSNRTPLVQINQGEKSAPRQFVAPVYDKPLSSRMDSISQFFGANHPLMSL